MDNFNMIISPLEWGLLVSVGIAIIVSCLAWCRASRVLQLVDTPPVAQIYYKEKPAANKIKKCPQASLELNAYQNDYGQVVLKLSNTGMLVARKINLIIDEPDNIFDAESMVEGSELESLSMITAISPRLSVLDVDNILPIKEISSGRTLELTAVLTMSHGKVCEFPASLRWIDGNGAVQQKRVKLTV